jgi:hypothetical protein
MRSSQAASPLCPRDQTWPLLLRHNGVHTPASACITSSGWAPGLMSSSITFSQSPSQPHYPGLLSPPSLVLFFWTCVRLRVEEGSPGLGFQVRRAFNCQSSCLSLRLQACATMPDLFIWLILCVCGTGVWTPWLYLEPLHQPFFMMGFFSREGLTNYLPPAGFKPQSSWSLPPE